MIEIADSGAIVALEGALKMDRSGPPLWEECGLLVRRCAGTAFWTGLTTETLTSALRRLRPCSRVWESAGVEDDAVRVGRLAAARARREQLAGHSDSSAWNAAFEAELSAGRALAKARGEQYAETVDLGLQWDTGAPCPYLLTDGGRAVIVFYLRRQDPAWDGTYTTIIDPSSRTDSELGIIEMRGVISVRMGAPNDEALDGHPLSDRGLEAYAAHLVHNSEWLSEHIAINSVHPKHSDESWQKIQHFLFSFHDEMVECLAKEVVVRRYFGTFRSALQALCLELLDRN